MGGLLCELLLRFEFLGGAVERLIRALELFVFVYVACRCIRLILRWRLLTAQQAIPIAARRANRHQAK